MKLVQAALFTSLASTGLFLAACDPGPYSHDSGYHGSRERDCRYYGDCNRYDSRYRHDDDYYRNREDNRYRNYPDNGYSRDANWREEHERHEREERREREDRERKEDRERRERDQQRDRESRHVAPPPPAEIRPSCPSGTSFDGKHCILPENQRRPGGKGTVSACPNGMWVSDGKCVGK